MIPTCIVSLARVAAPELNAKPQQLSSICNASRAALGNGHRNTNVVSKSVVWFFSVNLVATLEWRLVHSLVAFTAVLLFDKRTSLVFGRSYD